MYYIPVSREPVEHVKGQDAREDGLQDLQ
jgi:hypothetical protein